MAFPFPFSFSFTVTLPFSFFVSVGRFFAENVELCMLAFVEDLELCAGTIAANVSNCFLVSLRIAPVLRFFPPLLGRVAVEDCKRQTLGSFGPAARNLSQILPSRHRSEARYTRNIAMMTIVSI